MKIIMKTVTISGHLDDDDDDDDDDGWRMEEDGKG